MQDLKQPTATTVIPRTAAMGWLAVAMAVSIFIVDLLTLEGRGEAVLYVIVVLLFLWSTWWRYVLGLAAVCSLLTIVCNMLSPADAPARADVTNHVFSFAAVWLTAILGLRMNRLSDKLANSEAQTRAIVESAAEGIITIDELGTVESFNESAASMFGYDSAEVIGENVQQLMPPDFHDAHTRGLANYLNTGEKHIIGNRSEVLGLRKDGTTFPLLIGVSEVRIERRRLFVGIVLDMTDLRLAQDRAVQSERLAAIGEAMAGLAHESRNALQRSQAALEMLARAIAAPAIDGQADATDLIDRIQAAQDDLHRLYEEVRGYAAPTTLQTQPCRVDAIVQDAWGKLSVSRQGRDARLEQAGDHMELTCTLDPFAMRRVFRNIIENSFDAIEGPIRIRVSYAEVMLEGRAAIEVSLRDNGPGLNDEALRRLFEPFFTTKTSGTGLGMPIAKRYIEAHGGVFDVSTSSNQGTEFRVTLPRTQP